MDKNQYIWNLANNRCIKMSQIKEFTIQSYSPFSVLAWLNQNDNIIIKNNDSKEAAVLYLKNLLS